MEWLKNLEVDRNILYTDSYFSGDYNHNVYLKRVNDVQFYYPKFYINIYTNINGETVQQGYLYFYLDEELKASYFIGIRVDSEYRNLNIGSFLVATWIDLCLNSGYDFLGANKRQRKPFLLYLLKTYGFEIFDKSLYETRKDVITICRNVNLDDKRKFLLFKDFRHEKVFRETNIYKSDNYEIIDNSNHMICLDRVILPLQNARKNEVFYELMDLDLAVEKSSRVLARHRK